MNVRTIIILGLSAIVAAWWLTDTAYAQCAMCVTALEQNGGEIAAGFNRGILFLLGMPYFVFGAIGVSWYWKRKQRHRKLETVPASEH